ncbi:glycosyltransferase family 9 protein [Roseivirga sp. 4D4]|uniref:glycosyltransferase family 9 protein n=1 Tax=Roseivirga sp. 4D4 TaxID=1889784 RepID=UPI001480408D|nr:glycosyltransferase family 9 protein [Roseivirga sp. 4D4]
MATSIVNALREKYIESNLIVSASYPELFYDYETANHSFLTFPVIWLSYTYYDFIPWVKNEPLHCAHIMAKLAGLGSEFKYKPQLVVNALDHQMFFNKHIASKNYIVIQPTAGGWLKEKNWKKTAWDELLEELKKDYEIVYQIGTEADPAIENAIDLRGKTTIYESFLLVKHAQLLVGVNSFAEQASWAFNTSSVILYGPTNPMYSLNPSQFAVFSNQVTSYDIMNTKRYEFPSIEEVEPITVLEAIRQAAPIE